VCDVDFYLFKSLDDAYNGVNAVDRTNQIVNGDKEVKINNARGPLFVKVILNTIVDQSETLKATDY